MHFPPREQFNNFQQTRHSPTPPPPPPPPPFR
ncbi:hypothetical protein OOU_Y34scaffold00591g2 [Pyricularia oryzae Y34]|uniref:Uncharacterized protein n=1 Tax=Pyricularia oryzae (strain Y34) TaxID=1143189 RepID=A0AA97NW31_PYRO3|nr:hypothetical protein OOU_Y34scaffold00591g2 [Pyricularia oryzae Y34]